MMPTLLENYTNLPKLVSISILGMNTGGRNSCSVVAALTYQENPVCYDWHDRFFNVPLIYSKWRAYFGPHFSKESEKFSVLLKETSCNHLMSSMMWDIALCSTVTSIFQSRNFIWSIQYCKESSCFFVWGRNVERMGERGKGACRKNSLRKKERLNY